MLFFGKIDYLPIRMLTSNTK